MTLEQVLLEAIKYLLVGGAGGLAVAIAQALKMRSDSKRDDRKQLMDESSAIAANAQSIANSASSVVKLHDDQAAELKQEISQLRADLNGEREHSKTDHEAMSSRLAEAENRLARAERRAGESERQAHEFRQDVIQLGERLERERKESQARINKLVIIIESLFKKLQAAGVEPDLDLEDLKRMYVIEKGAA